MTLTLLSLFFFFFNDTATTEIYTLSLHDALPICPIWAGLMQALVLRAPLSALWWAGTLVSVAGGAAMVMARDRKSTRLNSSHSQISYAVFCLKKKNTNRPYTTRRPKSCLWLTGGH